MPNISKVQYNGSLYGIEGVVDDTLSVSRIAADAAKVGDEVTDLNDAIGGLSLALSEKIDGAYLEEGYLYLTSNDEVMVGPIGPFSGGGGGGGGQNDAVITVANTTGWLSTTISETEQCYLSFNWSSVEDDYPTGDGTLTVRVNGVVKVQQNVAQGNVEVNVREHLSSGTNIVRCAFSDVYGNTKSISFTVSLVALSISAPAFDISNASAVYTDAVTFTYTPVGAVSKNVVFKLDGTIIATQTVTTSGRQQTFIIPVQSHGAHAFEVYFTAEINGVTVSSNHLYYDLIFVVDGVSTPIIASPFNATGATQYYTISIPYTVYTPGSSTSEVSFEATVVNMDSETTVYDLGTRTVGQTQQTFTYLPSVPGVLTLKISTGSVSKSFTMSVAELNIDVEAETDSLQLYLSAKGRSNSESRPNSWSFNEISATFNDFNFVSDGWQLDENHATYLKVSGNARLTIPFNIFADDFKGTGKTIEFDFSTSDVMNYDAVVVSCYAEGKGIKITPQSVSFASASSNILTQYKEEEHVRVSFVVEKTSEHRLIYTYINGICSGIIQYPAGDDFQQLNPVGITVGSNDCAINLYTIRVYNNSLTRHQVLNNWIADTPDGATMLARYNHNNIYDAYGDIVINNLPNDLPYLIIESPTLPQYKGDKKTISGSFVNPIDPTKSFTYTGASCDVQGTSSAGYPRKNYKIKFSSFVNEDGEESSNYYLRGASDSLPTNVFCFKADYASSEGANNVELVRLYNDACPYKTEPQNDNALVRQGIDGIPIVIFWSNTAAGTVTFLGKYNFNYDKDSKVFGFASGDESWETLDNSNDWALFKRADYSGDDWEAAFEARYPDDYNNPANLSQVAQWINSTDRDAAPYDIRVVSGNDIVFRGGAHPASNSAANYNKAPSSSVFSLISLVRTKIYKWDADKVRASSVWNSEDGYLTTSGKAYAIQIGAGGTTYSSSSLSKTNGSNYSGTVSFNASTGGVIAWSTTTALIQQSGTYNYTSPANSVGLSDAILGDGIYIEIPVYEADVDDFYAYWGNMSTGGVYPEGVRNGDIIFAGRNTAYYGKKNINDAAITNFPSPVTYENVEYTFDSAQYRLAKFRNELTNWFNRNDVLFYYLFTELFLMVDSRVKNSFPTLYASHSGAKWCWLPYDMDTAIGINNEGALAFDYNLEDTDMLSSTAGVYNGYQTVMWNNVRDAFPSELASLYQSVRADGIISYDEVERRFEAHQSTWNEAIYNEDAYFKYIKPFIDDGENNLYMCLGSKAEQRKWWLYNRFRYIDSKYTAGLATATTLQMRVYQKSNLTITPYADIYASALFDSNLVKQKAHRGEATTLASPATWNPGGSDAVLRIYSADQIKSLGDLSGFYVGAASFAAATKLQEVKLGDASPSYSNENLTEVTFGANNLLKSIDIRNCPNFTGILDVSHCENLEVVHLEGTSVNGVSFADGGMISEVHLPDTVTNLTLRNLINLETLDLNDYSNITTLWIENTWIDDWLDVVVNDIAAGSRIRLIGFNKTYSNDADFTTFIRIANTMRGIDSSGNNLNDAYLEGEVTVNEISREAYDSLSRYPYLTVHYNTVGDYDYILYMTRSTKFIEYHDDVITTIRARAFTGTQTSNTTKSYLKVCDTPNVTAVGSNAFTYCTELVSVNMPNLLTLGSQAFQYDSKLTSVDFPNLTSVGTSAFAFCTALVSASLGNITSLPDTTFQNCTSLRNLSLPYNLSSIGTNCFSAAKITSFAVNATAVYACFTNCTQLTAVDFGPSFTTNRVNTFSGCTNLRTVVLRKTTVLALHGVNVFASTGTPFAEGGSGGTIYIPKSLYDHLGDGTSLDYKADSNWAAFDAYGTITWMPIEGSIYETQYVDGRPVEGGE